MFSNPPYMTLLLSFNVGPLKTLKWLGCVAGSDCFYWAWKITFFSPVTWNNMQNNLNPTSLWSFLISSCFTSSCSCLSWILIALFIMKFLICVSWCVFVCSFTRLYCKWGFYLNVYLSWNKGWVKEWIQLILTHIFCSLIQKDLPWSWGTCERQVTAAETSTPLESSSKTPPLVWQLDCLLNSNFFQTPRPKL